MQTKWDSKNISDQRGKVVIVTGSSSGIGLETAKILAGKNAIVIIAVRNLKKGEAALQEIRTQFPETDARIMELDLTQMASIKDFAANFRRSFSRLDLLINNAGVMVPPYQKTADGFELQMGTNHLGHFALTGLLIDVLKNTLASRIVNVSSFYHYMFNFDFEDLNCEKSKYIKLDDYCDSKIANLYFTFALQKLLKNENSHIMVAAAHPGWTATKLQRHVGLVSFANHIFAQTIPMGALPTLYAATAPDVSAEDFFGPSGFMEMKGYPKKVAPNTRSRDPELAEKLWKMSEELTGVTFS